MNGYLFRDLYAKSNNDIVAELGKRFRDYRIALRLTQKEVADQTGVSVMTIVRFERGEGSAIRLDNFVALMRAIQKLDGIADAIPNMPVSLYDGPREDSKVKYRVKKRKDEK
ncbi:MAG: helix-turn-helix transcriptional regulator [Bacteroidales bacterium]|nr:helix-turn-helix transcriptional regulator [Bacteroidales bacterium]